MLLYLRKCCLSIQHVKNKVLWMYYHAVYVICSYKIFLINWVASFCSCSSSFIHSFAHSYSSSSSSFSVRICFIHTLGIIRSYQPQLALPLNRSHHFSCFDSIKHVRHFYVFFALLHLSFCFKHTLRPTDWHTTLQIFITFVISLNHDIRAPQANINEQSSTQIRPE